MSSESPADEVLQQRARLKNWANTTSSTSATAIVNDLTEIWAASRALVAAIEALSEDDQHASGRRLIEIQTWLYEELLDHAESLKAPLQLAIADAYEHG